MSAPTLHVSLLPRLGSAYASRIAAQALPRPHWLAHSFDLARELGLDEQWLQSQEALQLFAGNNDAGPEFHATVYSGHQFGQWAGQLGDGRAVLLGSINTPVGEQELQLKGAGSTPYSRMGDGRAVLRSSIREFLCSEAMHALGIPTTRTLALVGAPASVQRETRETAAVVTRVAPSFIRFGHFEHFAAQNNVAALRTLADGVIDHYYPECRAAASPYAALLQAVSERTADLMAQWQAVGFCHGVMNTDNMSILGLTIDYGPFQFLDGFDPAHICNHSDTQGRYRYSNQPNMAYWNLFCLGQALLPLIAADKNATTASEQALAAVEVFKPRYEAQFRQAMAAKLGLPQLLPAQMPVLQQLLALLAAERVDWTIFWRRWAEAIAGAADATEAAQMDMNPVRDLFMDRVAFDVWTLSIQELLRQVWCANSAKKTLKTNPHTVLRNYLAQNAIAQAQTGDVAELARLLQALQNPYEALPEFAAYADFPPAWAGSISVSCSS